MFFKKEDKKGNIPLSKIGSLLIHAAKIDQHYILNPLKYKNVLIHILMLLIQ